jgi:hypothetical protein
VSYQQRLIDHSGLVLFLGIAQVFHGEEILEGVVSSHASTGSRGKLKRRSSVSVEHWNFLAKGTGSQVGGSVGGPGAA